MLLAASLVISLALAMLVLVPPQESRANGVCEPVQPTLTSGVYQLATVKNLMWVRDDSRSWDDSFVLTQDIDMAACPWDSMIAPLDPRAGAGLPAFTGVIDGNGYAIENLTVAIDTASVDDSRASHAGFIGVLSGNAQVHDITFRAATVTLDDTIDFDDSVQNVKSLHAGVVVAEDIGSGSTLRSITVTDSRVEVSMANARLPDPNLNNRWVFVGGIAGYVSSDGVSGLRSARNTVVAINAQNPGRSTVHAGGIIGQFAGVEIADLHSVDDSVTAASEGLGPEAGGAVGVQYGDILTEVRVVNPDVLAMSSADASAGGAIGESGGQTVSDVRVSGGQVRSRPWVTGNVAYAGGAIGYSDSGATVDVHVSGTTVSASGEVYVTAGGVIGQADDDTLAQVSSNAQVMATTLGLERSTASNTYAGGLIGYLAGPKLSSSVAWGDVTASSDDTLGRVDAGGLLGGGTTISGRGEVSDSYATGSATAGSSGDSGVAQAGGLAGYLFGVPVTRSYGTGAPTATAPLGDDTVGGLVGDDAGAVITDSYWNTETSGVGVSAGGAGLTSAQMRDAASFTGWQIVAGWQPQTSSGAPPRPTAPFWGQCDVNSGFPYLLWQYSSSPCAGPAPPSPTPAGAPRDLAVVAGDGEVAASWQPPSSSGSFPVTSYQVEALPAGGSCLTATLTCTVSGLPNGVEQSVRVRALTGAGWGSWSEPIVATPRRERVRITGAWEGRRVQVAGISTVTGVGTVQVWLRTRAWGEFRPVRPLAAVAEDGTFEWAKRLKRRVPVRIYVVADDVRSNTVRLTPRSTA